MGGFGKETQEERIICIHIAESQVVLMVKNLPANAGNIEFNPWVRKTPGGGNGNPLQYLCLENPMDRGA